MSTKALIKFYETLTEEQLKHREPEAYFAYVWGNGEPWHVVKMIKMATFNAYDLPRWQADDFTAAFFAANRPKGSPFKSVFASNGEIREKDFEYHVTFKDDRIFITILYGWEETTKLWEGTLEDSLTLTIKQFGLERV